MHARFYFLIAVGLVALSAGCSNDELEVRVETELTYCANFHFHDEPRLLPSSAFRRNVEVNIPAGDFLLPLEHETREPEVAQFTDVELGVTVNYPNLDIDEQLTLPRLPMTALAETNLLLGHKSGSTTLTTADLAPLFLDGERSGWLRMRFEVRSPSRRAVLRPFSDEEGANRTVVFTHDADLSQCDLSDFNRARVVLGTERGDFELSWLFAELDWARVAPLADLGSLTTEEGEVFSQDDWHLLAMDSQGFAGGFLFDEPNGNTCGYWAENFDNPMGINPGPAAQGYEIECGTLELIHPFEILSYESIVEWAD